MADNGREGKKATVGQTQQLNNCAIVSQIAKKKISRQVSSLENTQHRLRRTSESPARQLGADQGSFPAWSEEAAVTKC